MSAKKIAIVLICCLLVVLGTAVCALLDLYPDGYAVVYADDSQLPSFVIATADGNNWTLSQDGVNVDGAERSGRFVIANNPYCPAMKMYQAIQKCLRESGADVPQTGDFVVAKYCNISFSLPDIDVSVSDNTAEFASQGVLFDTTAAGIVSTPQFTFEYRVEDGEWRSSVADSARGTDGFYFGNGVNAGVYKVRLVATEVIKYEVNDEHEPIEYVAKRCSGEVECVIEKASLPTPSAVSKDVEYGKSIADIANSLRMEELVSQDIPGRFVPSEHQTDETMIAATDKASVYLQVGNPHTVYYDFVPDNANFKTVSDIAVNVSVSPRSLFVSIRSAFSFLGEDVVEPKYEILTALVGSDTTQSLGASIKYEVDKDVPGKSYRTYVEFSNPNYVADCHSYENQFAAYGMYFVYAEQVKVIADDGQEFSVFLVDGIADVVVSAKRVSVESAWDKNVVCAYEFSFVDKYGDDVTPEDGFTVSWQNPPENSGYVAVLGREDVVGIGADGVTLSKQFNVLCFLEKEFVPEVLTARNIALIACCSVLACAVLVLCVVWKKQRRYLV